MALTFKIKRKVYAKLKIYTYNIAFDAKVHSLNMLYENIQYNRSFRK